MNKNIYKINASQSFALRLPVKFLYQLVPKVRGYWKFTSFVSRYFPLNWVVGRAHLNIEGRTVSVPIDLRDPYEIDVFSKNKHELAIPAVIAKLLPENGCFVDVGSNCGWYSRIVARLAPSCDVIAFEPSHRAFSFIRQLAIPNILVLPYAISDEDAKILRDDSSWYRQSSSSTFVKSDRNDYMESPKDVFSRSLDEILPKFSREPDFLKIDVEGAEFLVLKGAMAILERVKYVLVEINDEGRCCCYGYSYKEIYSYLERRGFSYMYEVRNSDNSVSELRDGQKICGDILFSRYSINGAFK